MFSQLWPPTVENGLGDIIPFVPEVSFNAEKQGIEVRFGGNKPTEEVRNLLKEKGFRFSRKQEIWYAKDTPERKAFVLSELAEPVQVNDTKYEVHFFWKRVHTWDVYNSLPKWTEFGNGKGQFYNSKRALEAKENIGALLKSGLMFKKYYSKAVEVEDKPAPKNPSPNPNKTAKDSNRFAVADKLREVADGMEKAIEGKLNPAIGNQNQTARRARIAASMRQEGYQMQEVQRILRLLADGHEQSSLPEFLKGLRTKLDVERLRDAVRAKRFNPELAKRGITASNFQTAWQALEAMLKNGKGPESKKQKLLKEILQAEAKLIGAKIDGFFPTPKPLIERMLDMAELEGDSGSWLEPSAGKGDILEAIFERFPRRNAVFGIERMYDLRQLLKLKKRLPHWSGFDLIEREGNDFLEIANKFAQDLTFFSRILMNPPFEKGQDIDHLQAAYSILKHRGIVVAVVSEGPFFRQTKKDVAFREWLDEVGAEVSAPIQDAFKGVASFRQTGITVRLVKIVREITQATKPKLDDKELLRLRAKALALKLKLQNR